MVIKLDSRVFFFFCLLPKHTQLDFEGGWSLFPCGKVSCWTSALHTLRKCAMKIILRNLQHRVVGCFYLFCFFYFPLFILLLFHKLVCYAPTHFFRAHYKSRRHTATAQCSPEHYPTPIKTLRQTSINTAQGSGYLCYTGFISRVDFLLLLSLRLPS